MGNNAMCVNYIPFSMMFRKVNSSIPVHWLASDDTQRVTLSFGWILVFKPEKANIPEMGSSGLGKGSSSYTRTVNDAHLRRPNSRCSPSQVGFLVLLLVAVSIVFMKPSVPVAVTLTNGSGSPLGSIIGNGASTPGKFVPLSTCTVSTEGGSWTAWKKGKIYLSWLPTFPPIAINSRFSGYFQLG